MDPRQFTEQINKAISHLQYGEHPPELYEPIRYIMALGGKRMRPLLTLMSYNLFKEDWEKALKPALAVEVFHNFTLMHDDIMDNAPLRRGKKTVHEMWNNNIAILSGDVMLVNAYELLLDVEDKHLRKVIRSFNLCAAEVCEGQQLDMNFENKSIVTEEAYIDMIRLKTAVLLGFGLELGGIIAGASENNCHLLKSFGENMGIGFQLKDDLLDVFGDAEKFGKQVGGDILSNKKTFLLIKALELSQNKEKEMLDYWLSLTNFDKEEKVKAITEIYLKLDIKSLTEKKMNEYFDLAFQQLDTIQANKENKQLLSEFAKQIINREK